MPSIPPDGQGRTILLLRAFHRDCIFFLKTLWGGPGNLYFIPFASFHKRIIERIETTKKMISVVAVPREFGKTKLVSMGYIMWRIMFRKTSYVLHISYCEEKGKQIMRDLKRAVKSKAFKKMFGDLQGNFWSQTRIHLYSKRWKIDCIIQIAGADQSSFGLSEWKSRPDLIILDDIETLQTIKNKDIVKAYIEKFKTEIIPAAEMKDEYGRQAKIIVIGTPLAANTFLTEIIGWKDDTEAIIYPAIVDNKAFPGMSDDLGIPEGQSIYPARWSTEYLNRRKRFLIRTNSYRTWLTQYMMDAKSEAPMKFDRDKLIEVEFKDIQGKLTSSTVRATVDMAYTKKDSNDAVGITIAIHEDGSHITYLESMKVHCTANVLYDILWKLKRKYSKCKDYTTAIESKVFELVKLYFWEVQMRTGRSLSILPLEDRCRNKDDRIGRMVPFYETGLMKFVKGTNDPLLEEMFDWYGTSRGEDNVVDAAAYQIDFVEVSDAILEDDPEMIAARMDDQSMVDPLFTEEDVVEVSDKTDASAAIAVCKKLQKEQEEMFEEAEDGEYPAWLDGF